MLVSPWADSGFGFGDHTCSRAPKAQERKRREYGGGVCEGVPLPIRVGAWGFSPFFQFLGREVRIFLCIFGPF